ncbi:MAG: MFS transporter [Deltaproteobacteria bacterium]|nr:MFS transporter [Deltaproteobacteria bacterium]
MRARLAGYAAFYAGYYAALGSSLPFLAAYFDGIGFDAGQIGVLFSFSPLMLCLTPMAVGYLADRWRPLSLLRLATLAAMIAALALSQARQFGGAAVAMLAFAIATAPIVPLADAQALRASAAEGASFGRVRLFGSLGFVVFAAGMGIWLEQGGVDTRVPLAVAVGLGIALITTAAWRPPSLTRSPLEPREALALLRQPRLRMLLICSALHWSAMGPYHSFFALHVKALALSPSVVGWSMAAGSLAEVAAMWAAKHWVQRSTPEAALRLSFVVTAIRWALSAWVDQASALIAVQLLHGFSFGVFYVVAMSMLMELVPDRLRNTGQGLFVAGVFGVGGGVGVLAGGFIIQLASTRALFALGSALTLLAAALMRRRPAQPVPVRSRLL